MSSLQKDKLKINILAKVTGSKSSKVWEIFLMILRTLDFTCDSGGANDDFQIETWHGRSHGVNLKTLEAGKPAGDLLSLSRQSIISHERKPWWGRGGRNRFRSLDSDLRQILCAQQHQRFLKLKWINTVKKHLKMIYCNYFEWSFPLSWRILPIQVETWKSSRMSLGVQLIEANIYSVLF